MSDDWEDWEHEDFIIPVLSVPNEEQLKRLEERKLVEESDNILAKDLFSNDEENLKKLEKNNICKQFQRTEKKAPIKIVVNKQHEHEEKQKALSKQIKEDKLRKERERELYGEAHEDDAYAKYEDYEDKYC